MASGNMKDIKRRIKSVESTMQITKAMELVASSKLRKAKEKADNARPFFNALYDTMCDIQAENPGFFSQYTKRREVKTVLLVVIAGDRGLAGGFNANVLKLAEARIDELKAAGMAIKIIAIGKKASEHFVKRGYTVMESYINVAEGMNIYRAADISDKIVQPFVRGEADRVELFRTEYVSPLLQKAESLPLLPLDISGAEKKSHELPIYEPSPRAVFDSIVPKYITGIVFGAVVDSFASEQAARRTAMESASDNAGEMISSLSLLYNRARQASITQEITEIVGGASAQE